MHRPVCMVLSLRALFSEILTVSVLLCASAANDMHPTGLTRVLSGLLATISENASTENVTEQSYINERGKLGPEEGWQLIEYNVKRAQ